MKKTISLLFAFIFLFSVCTSAFDLVTYEGGKYSYTYTGATDGEYYTMILLQGALEEYPAELPNEQILFFDQVLGANQTAVFDFYPKIDDLATLFVGGYQIETPIRIGVITPTTGYLASGTITPTGSRTTKMNFIRLDNDGTPTTNVYSFDATKDNNYTFSLTLYGSDAHYKITAASPGYTKYTNNSLPVNADITDMNITLYPGNTNNDDVIDILDIATQIQLLTISDPSADIDDSGVLDMEDINIILKNYGRTSITETGGTENANQNTEGASGQENS